MTNILASILVTLVTNTAEVYPTQTVGVPCPGASNGFTTTLLYCSKEEPIENPQTKDIVTTVTRITTEKWTFPDGKVLLERETNRELVSESRRHFVKDWAEVKGEPPKQYWHSEEAGLLNGASVTNVLSIR